MRQLESAAGKEHFAVVVANKLQAPLSESDIDLIYVRGRLADEEDLIGIISADSCWMCHRHFRKSRKNKSTEAKMFPFTDKIFISSTMTDGSPNGLRCVHKCCKKCTFQSPSNYIQAFYHSLITHNAVGPCRSAFCCSVLD